MPRTTNKKKVSKSNTMRLKPENITALMGQGEYQERIAFEAFLIAEKRYFQGGDPVDDWFCAKNKVEQQLNLHQYS